VKNTDKRDASTRRDVVAGLGLAAAFASIPASLTAATLRGPSPQRRGILVPKNAIDCHVHVFDPARFPYAASRSYTPGVATLDQLTAFEKTMGVDRVVLVHPSPYGSDNSALLDALRRLGKKRARGVAVINPQTVTDSELRALTDAGVVAVRVNLTVQGIDKATAASRQISAALARVAGAGLAIQVYGEVALVENIVPLMRDATVPVILDHFAGAEAALGTEQQGFATLLRAMERGNVWVKMSAPYRASELAPNYPDLAPLAKAMIAAAPERVVWASDWPHTGGGAERQGRKASDVEPFRTIDDAHNLQLIREWAGSDAIFRRILVDNPAKLFRF